MQPSGRNIQGRRSDTADILYRQVQRVKFKFSVRRVKGHRAGCILRAVGAESKSVTAEAHRADHIPNAQTDDTDVICRKPSFQVSMRTVSQMRLSR